MLSSLVELGDILHLRSGGNVKMERKSENLMVSEAFYLSVCLFVS